MLWSLATMNCDGRRTRIASLWTLKCWSLVCKIGHKIANQETLFRLTCSSTISSNNKYIHCCIKIVLEWTTAPALAHSTTMSGTAVFHSAQCVTIETTSLIECSTEKGSKPASYKSQGVARLEILQSEWNHNRKYDKRVDFCNILNGPPATIVPRLGRDNACFSIVTDWNRLELANPHLLTGP